MPPRNVSTVSWNNETIERFEIAYRKAGYRSRAHFFDLAGLAFIEQIEAGEKLIYPPRFQIEKRAIARKPKRK
jgi:hypothetical protein